MDQGVNKLQPGAKSGLLPLFINKVLSELSHALSLMYFPRLLSVCSGRAEQLPRRPHGPHSQKCVGPIHPAVDRSGCDICHLWIVRTASLVLAEKVGAPGPPRYGPPRGNRAQRMPFLQNRSSVGSICGVSLVTTSAQPSRSSYHYSLFCKMYVVHVVFPTSGVYFLKLGSQNSTCWVKASQRLKGRGRFLVRTE